MLDFLYDLLRYFGIIKDPYMDAIEQEVRTCLSGTSEALRTMNRRSEENRRREDLERRVANQKRALELMEEEVENQKRLQRLQEELRNLQTKRR